SRKLALTHGHTPKVAASIRSRAIRAFRKSCKISINSALSSLHPKPDYNRTNAIRFSTPNGVQVREPDSIAVPVNRYRITILRSSVKPISVNQIQPIVNRYRMTIEKCHPRGIAQNPLCTNCISAECSILARPAKDQFVDRHEECGVHHQGQRSPAAARTS